MLINCVVYQDGAKLADIPVADISDYMIRAGLLCVGGAARCNPQELDEMKVEFGLHDLAVEDARHGHQRPKIEEYGDSLFAVMHLLEPATEGGTQAINVGEVDVFAGSNYDPVGAQPQQARLSGCARALRARA